MARKNLGLLAAYLRGVPPLSAYAYQRSVSLLLAFWGFVLHNQRESPRRLARGGFLPIRVNADATMSYL